ncbi:unnamed protein product [Lymnaea stagnalis]|uniref:VWFA domain-containing protein n=1 Tax=Lymnaea stagnalis TaxID=6523 RepID=A0AAV2HBF1_LYMST
MAPNGTAVVSTMTPSSTASPLITQCTASADIVFVLDASGSIGDVQYRLVLSFVKNFINSSTSGSSSDLRFGLVIFSDSVQKISELNTYNDIQELNKAIDDAPYPGGFTYTNKGLNMARQMFLLHGRVNTPHVIILMTDGYSTSRNQTLLESQGLRVSNITMISIGLGDIIDQSELNEISKPGDVFVVKDYNKLKDFLGQLLNKFCQTVSGSQISTGELAM